MVRVTCSGIVEEGLMEVPGLVVCHPTEGPIVVLALVLRLSLPLVINVHDWNKGHLKY